MTWFFDFRSLLLSVRSRCTAAATVFRWCSAAKSPMAPATQARTASFTVAPGAKTANPALRADTDTELDEEEEEEEEEEEDDEDDEDDEGAGVGPSS